MFAAAYNEFAIKDWGLEMSHLQSPISNLQSNLTDSSMTSAHVPVLMREVLAGLELRPGLKVVDGTVGGGGHSREILPRIRPGGRLLGLDRDPMMLALAGEALTGSDVSLRQASYVDLPEILQQFGWSGVDRILVDLGLSSDQLADDSRGFGFHSTGDLDLRFDRSQGVSAAELLATASVDELGRIFRDYGEEPHSVQIAEYLVRQRTAHPVRTGAALTVAIETCLRIRRHDRDTHPATRVFQALRIAVNQELEHVRHAVEDVFPACLNPGGILAVISFHSLEDRIVKQAFRNRDVWESLTPKPIVASPAEVRFNPRSRSAKLRQARKTSTTSREGT